MKLIIIVVTIAIGIFQFAIHYYLKHKRIKDLADKFPGPPALPILGNIFNYRAKSSSGKLKLKKS